MDAYKDPELSDNNQVNVVDSLYGFTFSKDVRKPNKNNQRKSHITS